MIVHLLAKPLVGGMPEIDSEAIPAAAAVTGMQRISPPRRVEVLGPGGVKQAAAREEEQALEDDVVQDVEQGAEDGHGGQRPDEGVVRPGQPEGRRRGPGRCSRSGRSSCRPAGAWRRSA